MASAVAVWSASLHSTQAMSLMHVLACTSRPVLPLSLASEAPVTQGDFGRRCELGRSTRADGVTVLTRHRVAFGNALASPSWRSGPDGKPKPTTCRIAVSYNIQCMCNKDLGFDAETIFSSSFSSTILQLAPRQRVAWQLLACSSRAIRHRRVRRELHCSLVRCIPWRPYSVTMGCGTHQRHPNVAHQIRNYRLHLPMSFCRLCHGRLRAA